MSKAAVATYDWIVKNKEKIDGKPLMQIFRMCPIIVGKNSFESLLLKAGVKLGMPEWSSHRSRREFSLFPLNWDLPNAILCRVWNQTYHLIATERTCWKRGKPKWDMRGFKGGNVILNPVFQDTVTKEVQKAREITGRDATSVIDKYFNRKAAMHRSNYKRPNGNDWSPEPPVGGYKLNTH
jgi:hypothetical protein